jgi:hypothetical protein
MTIKSVSYRSQITTVETITAGDPAATGSADLTHSGYDTSANLNPNTTPGVDTPVYQQFALSAGAVTIDLTSLTGPGGAAVSLNGKKVVLIRFSNPSTNANSITVKKGATNGYAGLDASFSVTIPPGGDVTFYSGGGSSAVGASNKTLDLTGTASQVLNVSVVGGP